LRTLSDPPKYRDNEAQNRSGEEEKPQQIMEADPNTLQAIENLETQLKRMMERVKKSEEEQIKLKETIHRKDEQIKNFQQQLVSDPNVKPENLLFVHKEIKCSHWNKHFPNSLNSFC